MMQFLCFPVSFSDWIFLSTIPQIILRARQAYLYNQYKESIATLSPDIITDIRNGWDFYAKSKLTKVDGAVESATADWKQFEAKLTTEEVLKAVKVEEKFKMYVEALVCSSLVYSMWISKVRDILV